jgi:large subunit ribosomal protein L19
MDISSLVETKPNPNIPDISPGDTVKISVKVVEGDKERIQAFQGVVLKLRHGADGGSFTMRRVTHGVGVERTFLFRSPLVEKVELLRHGKVRRAKLYYLRERSGKAARIKEKRQARGKEPAES